MSFKCSKRITSLLVINHHATFSNNFIYLYFCGSSKTKLWKNLSFMNITFYREVCMFQEYINMLILNCFLMKIHVIVQEIFFKSPF